MEPGDRPSGATFDLREPRRVHIVGIGGAGMSAIATVLARMGHAVTGSDLKDAPTLERLRALGVSVAVGHGADRLPAPLDAVVVSTAIPATNPEVVAARERGVPVLRRAEVLGLITRTRRTIAVSGTHGKTTTSSMTALILRTAGWQPSFVIGGDLNEVGGNAAYDDGEWLVVEADESDGTFLELEREAAVVTSVEPDHLEHWGTFDRLVGAFDAFLRGAPGLRLACADDATTAALAAEIGAVTYGFDAAGDYRIERFQASPPGTRFALVHHGREVGMLEVPVPGRHNARNAAAAAALATELGVGFDAVRDALCHFGGVARRFQIRGAFDGVTVVDDYAHLPTEVAAAIEAAREGPWARVVVVFQPHRFSRTEMLWQAFGPAFDGADVVVITDVYGAGERPRPGVSGHLLVTAITEACTGARVLYLPHLTDVARHLPAVTRAGDVVLLLGAGDVNSLAVEWIEASAR